MTGAFSLDSRLEAETSPIGDLALSRVLLMRDARFPWLILVPRRPKLVEVVDLDDADAAALFAEIRQACMVLKKLFSPHKLNVAALGNQVPQLHVHVIARFTSDDAWPKPVWGAGEKIAYDRNTLEARSDALARAFGFA
jgi:diadenosine tetraphosphate (Ap4A) HIT family hydrolase